MAPLAEAHEVRNAWRHAMFGAAALAGTAALLAGCGGGSGGDAGSGGTSPPPAGLTDAQRIAAATATAQSSANPCAAIAPFYWEVGDRTAALASGSVDSASSSTTYTASTPMSIASASKWIYAAYVVQRRNAALSDSDIEFLTFRSGYTNFAACQAGQTIDSCLAAGSNGVHSDGTDGFFYYNGGHMEKHASVIGLGALDNAGLASEVRSQLGSDIGLAYVQPQPAGGVITTPAAYALFLRKQLGGQLQMGALLGSHAVCTNPSTCPAEALATPVPRSETWHYSIGHWVEDDPAVGDGAFSSAGAFGFYPWIDVSKTWYGVLARQAADSGGEGYDSAQCGRLIRKAWVTGTAL